jgi:hypothetical protein
MSKEEANDSLTEVTIESDGTRYGTVIHDKYGKRLQNVSQVSWGIESGEILCNLTLVILKPKIRIKHTGNFKVDHEDLTGCEVLGEE